MSVPKIYLLAAALLVLCACQKEPSTSSLHQDYLVYTAHDATADFSAYTSYYLPDSVLIIGNSSKTVYWKDSDAQQVIAAVADGMNAAGYTRMTEKADAQLGLQLSYVEQVTYFVGYDNPYWWWYYPYYWSPGYWGDWSGWHYPYRVYYGYTAGSLLMEMVNLSAEQQSDSKLPVLWDSYIGGLLTSNAALNLQRTLDAVAQAFTQSSYLSH